MLEDADLMPGKSLLSVLEELTENLYCFKTASVSVSPPEFGGTQPVQKLYVIYYITICPVWSHDNNWWNAFQKLFFNKRVMSEFLLSSLMQIDFPQ